MFPCLLTIRHPPCRINAIDPNRIDRFIIDLPATTFRGRSIGGTTTTTTIAGFDLVIVPISIFNGHGRNVGANTRELRKIGLLKPQHRTLPL
jgi:hypothetical protein